MNEKANIKIAKITEDSITKQEYFDMKPTKKHKKKRLKRCCLHVMLRKKNENNKSNFTISKITLILM